MKKILFVLSLAIVSCAKQDQDQTNSKPNIIFIMADDLGYGELGVYGQEKIETPNIDALAAKGMKFNDFYSAAPVCAPARCMLLTGLHSGHAPVRGNDEWNERGDVWNLEAMFNDSNLEGQRPLPDSIFMLPQMLKNAGYATGIVGKWGLGGPQTNSVPTKKGFDFFYGYNCQRVAHTYYPPHLWKNEEKVILNNKLVPLHANLAKGVNANDSLSYADFNLTDYAPDLMHDEAIGFIKKNKDNPFFLYYASPVPHVPLQAPNKWVKYYRQKFGEEEPYTGNGYYPNQYPKATYAAMISYLDEQVGDIVKTLKEQGTYENTLIIFTSDNGPTYAGGALPEYFDSGKPFKSEFGRGKGFVYEGGIRVPMIASWPNKIKAGTESNLPSVFYDVLPTFADLIAYDLPIKLDGLSILPTLLNTKDQQVHDYLYWEFPENNGQQAIRMGDWKAVRQNLKSGVIKTELYNLKTDAREENDVAAVNPEILKTIEANFIKEHEQASIERFQIKVLD